MASRTTSIVQEGLKRLEELRGQAMSRMLEDMVRKGLAESPEFNQKEENNDGIVHELGRALGT